ncbi:14838_t:CDS:1, partial [Gigaspora rosea]
RRQTAWNYLDHATSSIGIKGIKLGFMVPVRSRGPYDEMMSFSGDISAYWPANQKVQ